MFSGRSAFQFVEGLSLESETEVEYEFGEDQLLRTLLRLLNDRSIILRQIDFNRSGLIRLRIGAQECLLLGT